MSDQQRPEDIAWYLDIIRGDATLGDLYGPQHVSEVLFGVTHRRLGRVAFDATKAGRGHQVAVVASAAGLLEPDVLADLIEEATSTGVVACWGLPDPANDGPAVLRRLLQRVDAGARRDVLRGLLLRLPSGITPALAEAVAHDDHLFAQIIQQATWPSIETALRRRLDLGLACRPFVGDLRSRGVVAVAAHHVPLLDLIGHIGDSDLHDFCRHAAFAAVSDQLRRWGRSAAPAIERLTSMVPHDPDTARALFEEAIANPHAEIRMRTAAGLGRLARFHLAVATTLLDTALDDQEIVVRRGAAAALRELAAADASAAVNLLDRVATDSDPEIRLSATDALLELVESARDDVERLLPLLAPVELDDQQIRSWIAVVTALASVEPGRAFEIFEKALESDLIWLRDEAAEHIGVLVRHDPHHLAEVMQTFVRGTDWTTLRSDTEAHCLWLMLQNLPALAEQNPALAARVIVTTVDVPSPWEYFAARHIQAVRDHDPVAAIAVINHILRHPSGWVRSYALQDLMLSFDQDPEFVVSTLGTALDDDDYYCRKCALQQLGELDERRPEVARSLMRRALSDPHPAIRLRAATFLCRSGLFDPNDVVTMIRTSEASEPDSKDFLEEAIVEAVVSLLRTHPSVAVGFVEELLVQREVSDELQRRFRSLLEQAPLHIGTLIERLRNEGRLHPSIEHELTHRTNSGDWEYDPLRLVEYAEWVIRNDDANGLYTVLRELHLLLPDHQLEAVDLMTAFLDDSREAVRTDACRQLPRFALHDPVLATPLLLQADRNGLLHDPETRIELARLAPGVLCDPLWGVVHGIDRSLAGVPDADQQLAEVTTADQLIGLISIFPVDPVVDRILTGASVDIGDVAFTIDVLRNQAQLRQNAAVMGNCTEGYDHLLSAGDILVVIRDPKGQPAYNAHLSRRPGRWIVLEVNSRFNAGGKECDTVRAELVRLLDPS